MKKTIAFCLLFLLFNFCSFSQKNNCEDWISKNNDKPLNEKVAELIHKKFEDKNLTGSYMRHVLQSDWKIIKNSMDVPVQKYIPVSFIYKDPNGICQSGITQIRQDNKGAGKYGECYIDKLQSESKIECDCLTKLTDWNVRKNSNGTKDPLDSNQ